MSDFTTPKGFHRIEAWTNGVTVVLLGFPPDEGDDPDQCLHDCDAMGCSSLGEHVLARLTVDDPLLRRWAEEQNAEAARAQR